MHRLVILDSSLAISTVKTSSRSFQDAPQEGRSLASSTGGPKILYFLRGRMGMFMGVWSRRASQTSACVVQGGACLFRYPVGATPCNSITAFLHIYIYIYIHIIYYGRRNNHCHTWRPYTAKLKRESPQTPNLNVVCMAASSIDKPTLRFGGCARQRLVFVTALVCSLPAGWQ